MWTVCLWRARGTCGCTGVSSGKRGKLLAVGSMTGFLCCRGAGDGGEGAGLNLDVCVCVITARLNGPIPAEPVGGRGACGWNFSPVSKELFERAQKCGCPANHEAFLCCREQEGGPLCLSSETLISATGKSLREETNPNAPDDDENHLSTHANHQFPGVSEQHCCLFSQANAGHAAKQTPRTERYISRQESSGEARSKLDLSGGWMETEGSEGWWEGQRMSPSVFDAEEKNPIRSL